MDLPDETFEVKKPAETAATSDKTLILREEGEILSVNSGSPETRIMLTRLHSKLKQQHLMWIYEDPTATGFDPNVILITIIEDLLHIGRTDLARLAKELMQEYGCYLSGEHMDNAKRQIRRMLNNGN